MADDFLANPSVDGGLRRDYSAQVSTNVPCVLVKIDELLTFTLEEGLHFKWKMKSLVS